MWLPTSMAGLGVFAVMVLLGLVIFMVLMWRADD